MATTKPVKAELIREYLPKHMDMGGTALAKLINDENPSVTVTPQEVSTMRSKLGLRRNGHRPPPAVEEQETHHNLADVAAVLEAVRKLVDLVGKEQLHRIVDLI